jgi:hypothetical protein
MTRTSLDALSLRLSVTPVYTVTLSSPPGSAS